MAEETALIGFGEAGQAFAVAGGWGVQVHAYDKLTDRPATAPAKKADYRRAGVAAAASLEAAVSGKSVIISLVTADQALGVAKGAAASLRPSSLFLDMNSVAPSTKLAGATAISDVGGHYVDVAIMAPVHPAGLGVPLLLSGCKAELAAERLAALGFSNLRVVGPRVGQASAIKMIRSVIVKGIEALTAEAMLAADAAGVADEVFASLDASEKQLPWADRADYALDRMMVHGLRRAAEMEEVVKMLEDLGIGAAMSRGTAARQREIGELRLRQPVRGAAGKVAQIRGWKADAA